MINSWNIFGESILSEVKINIKIGVQIILIEAYFIEYALDETRQSKILNQR